MELTFNICNGEYDVVVKPSPTNEKHYIIVINNQTIEVNREEWDKLKDLLDNSMDFIDFNKNDIP